MTHFYLFAFVACFSCACSVTASADIVVSPGDAACSDVTGAPFCSLSAAVRLASSNGVIRLAAQRYLENVAIDKSLRIVGASRDATVIDGGHRGSVFRINPAVDVTLENMTVTNGYSENGGGIYNEGRLTLRNCAISTNVAEHSGGGIYSGGSMSSQLVLERVAVVGNTALGDDRYNIKYGGGGIYSDAPLSVIDGDISDNTAIDNGGGIYSMFTRRREANLVEQLTEKMGIATAPSKPKMLLAMENAQAMTLRNVRIGDNRAANGGGLFVIGLADIRDSSIVGNAADLTPISGGGGIFAHFSAQLRLSNVVVAGNSASSRGGGIRYYSINDSHFDHAAIVDNRVGPEGEGAGLFVQSGSARVELAASVLDQNLTSEGLADNCAGRISNVEDNFIRVGSACDVETSGELVTAPMVISIDTGARVIAHESGL